LLGLLNFVSACLFSLNDMLLCSIFVVNESCPLHVLLTLNTLTCRKHTSV
jgi:hypothetical protein